MDLSQLGLRLPTLLPVMLELTSRGWADAKFNVVKTVHKSSLRAGRELASYGKEPEAVRLPFPEFACHGGGECSWGPMGLSLTFRLPSLDQGEGCIWRAAFGPCFGETYLRALTSHPSERSSFRVCRSWKTTKWAAIPLRLLSRRRLTPAHCRRDCAADSHSRPGGQVKAAWPRT